MSNELRECPVAVDAEGHCIACGMNRDNPGRRCPQGRDRAAISAQPEPAPKAAEVTEYPALPEAVGWYYSERVYVFRGEALKQARADGYSEAEAKALVQSAHTADQMRAYVDAARTKGEPK